MPDDITPRLPNLTPEQDERCDRFEAAWKAAGMAGTAPRIEDHLGEPAPGRVALLHELTALDLVYRRRRGETPRAEDYLARFPELRPDWLAHELAREVKPDSTTDTTDGTPPTQKLRCPHCHNPIVLSDYHGDEVLCPGCGGSFRVRDASLTNTASTSRPMGKFQLLQRVGQGAFGAVWKARDTVLDRVVALKIPHSGRLTETEELERFHREARAAAQLRHPGIVPVHEVLTLEGLPTIVSEFVQGVTLKDFLEVRKLTFRESAALVADLAEALDYAHQMGLVHRDIKPANVMLENAQAGKGGRGRPLLMDFGLALRDEAEVTLTLDGQLIGTPAYMSPEQAAGRGHKADRRSDVYGLGVVFYELLTGELPFRGTKMMMLYQVISEEPRPPRKVNEKIPRDLETICLKCLRKEPEKRYGSARELTEDLRRWQAGEPIQARRVGRVERGVKWVRRSPVLAVMTMAMVLALVGGTIFSSYFAVEAREKEQKAVKKEKEANAALGEVEENLAIGLLRPLGHTNDEKKLNAFELDALEELASLPRERDRVRLLFLERALESKGKIRQLGRRLEESVIAAVGLRTDLRDQVLRTSEVCMRNEKTPRSVRNVCARLISSLSDEDKPIVQDVLGIMLLDLVKSQTEDSINTFPNWFASASGRLTPLASVSLGKQIIELAGKTEDSNALLVLSNGFAYLANKLTRAEATAMIKEVIEVAAGSTNHDVLRAMSEMFVALVDKLAPEQASTLAARMGRHILDQSRRAANPYTTRMYSMAFVACAAKMTQKDAESMGDNMRAPIIGRGAIRSTIRSQIDVYTALAGKLSSDGTTKLCTYIIAIMMDGKTNPVDLRLMSRVIEIVLSTLSPNDAANLSKSLSEWIIDNEGKRLSIYRGKPMPEEFLRAKSLVFAAIVGNLPAVDAKKEVTDLCQHIRDKINPTPNPATLLALSEAFAALANKLAPADASEIATMLLRQITEMTDKSSDPESVCSLCIASSSVKGILADADTNRIVNRLGEKLLVATNKVTTSDALPDLCDAFASLSDRLVPGLANKIICTLATRILDQLDNTTFPYQRFLLSEAFVVIVTHLSQTTASENAGPLVTRLVRTMHRTRNDRELSKALEELCLWLSPQQLIDLLKRPVCVEPCRTVILKRLGDRFKRSFRDVWELVEYIEQLSLPLDCAAPLSRDQKALQGRNS